MGSNLKYLHLNVNCSFTVACQLGKVVLSQSIDVISLNEPHVRDRTIIDRPDGYSEVISSDGQSRAEQPSGSVPVLITVLSCAPVILWPFAVLFLMRG